LPVTDAEFSATEAILSRHAEPTRRPPTAAEDVLSAGNVLVRPSPSREFQATDNLIIFFKLYNATPAAAAGKPVVRVTVTLMKDGKAAMKPIDYELSDIELEPVPHLTFAKYVKLNGLTKGKYSVLIEVRELAQNKVVKQEAWFTITQ
jgi:hypothetical protein